MQFGTGLQLYFVSPKVKISARIGGVSLLQVSVQTILADEFCSTPRVELSSKSHEISNFVQKNTTSTNSICDAIMFSCNRVNEFESSACTVKVNCALPNDKEQDMRTLCNSHWDRRSALLDWESDQFEIRSVKKHNYTPLLNLARFDTSLVFHVFFSGSQH